MAPQLVALSEGPNLPVDKPILLVGRHQECDVQIPSRKISRKHCCIAQVSDYLFVRDLQSTNGVRINGTRVPEGALHHGDELTIGNLIYRVDWVKANGNGAAAAPAKKAEPIQVPPQRPPVGEVSTENPVAIDDRFAAGAPIGLPLMLPLPDKKGPG